VEDRQREVIIGSGDPFVNVIILDAGIASMWMTRTIVRRMGEIESKRIKVLDFK
jgi:hypothetical protein